MRRVRAFSPRMAFVTAVFLMALGFMPWCAQAQESAPPRFAFLIGEWECVASGYHYRMHVHWDTSSKQLRGSLAKQGEGSASVGFHLGEHVWTAVPIGEPNILVELQKFRGGANGASSSSEWRIGKADLEQSSADHFVSFTSAEFRKVQADPASRLLPESTPDLDLTGTWVTTVVDPNNYSQFKVSIQITRESNRIIAILTDPWGVYLPLGTEAFSGTYDSSRFSAIQSCAYPGYQNPFKVKAQITIQSRDRFVESLLPGESCGGFPVTWTRIR